jgi:hypothetical protein
MSFPTSCMMDNGVLGPNGLEDVFFSWIVPAWAGGNRWGSERGVGRRLRTMACVSTTTSRRERQGGNRITNRIREDELCQHAVVLG